MPILYTATHTVSAGYLDENDPRIEVFDSSRILCIRGAGTLLTWVSVVPAFASERAVWERHVRHSACDYLPRRKDSAADAVVDARLHVRRCARTAQTKD